ncbi:MAG: hypothetical protein AUJ11_02015 [Parcubacteria group bacterium CG1_02_44_65]|nr:MAG: hypothetical protein AUJ11_02015 [Parcubacteria group bacterium CG1_02_44_65]
MTPKTTLCIILHYGDEQLTWDCVSSIMADDSLDILLADNDPAQKIKIPQHLQNKVRLFRTGGQAGFARANNLAVRAGRRTIHRFVLLLNNDTVILPNALLRLRDLLNQAEVGAVGPRINFASHPDRLWACGGEIKKFRVIIHGLKKIIKFEPYEVDYLPGAAILCKFIVWDFAGGLPEKYYLAYEEAEFALRLKRLNFRIMVDPEAKILHKVGMSADNQPMYLYNGIRNRIKFGQYLWGKLPGFFLAAAWSLVEARHKPCGFAIWSRAVSDEICGVDLNRQTLQNIKKSFAK